MRIQRAFDAAVFGPGSLRIFDFFDAHCGVVGDTEFDNSVELFTGGETTGLVCFDLSTDDAASAVLALDAGDSYLYFATS